MTGRGAVRRAGAALLVIGPLAWCLISAPRPGAEPPGESDSSWMHALEARLPGAVRGRDPHRFSCAGCHQAGSEPRDDRSWMLTCTSSGCHPRAWTETIFHRVDPAVFIRCVNCHSPHVWSVNGRDCRSCHSPSTDPAIPTRTAATAAMAKFPHERHTRFDCATCHTSTERHAVTTVGTFADCQSCHHSQANVADCSRCHESGGPAEVRKVAATMQLARDVRSEERTLPFDHARHRHLPCATCHTAPYQGKPRVDCASCHDGHHRAEASCATCHSPPPPAVHPLSLHENGCSGSGCHRDAGFEEMVNSRSLCLACHQDKSAHHPEGNCASCHLVTFGAKPAKGPP